MKRSIFDSLNRKARKLALPVLLGGVLMFSGCGFVHKGDDPPPPQVDPPVIPGGETPKPVDPVIDTGGDSPKPMPVEEVVAKARSSVVNIEAKNPDSGVVGKGSGIIYSANGYIVTNDHVLRGFTDFEVHLEDKRTFKAKRVGTDSRYDIAVLQIEGDNLQPLKFADSSAAKVGESVVAIGNAQGLENTTTSGIISNLSRDIISPDNMNFRRVIQIDAAINPGNSGGPFLNMKGEVVGITDMIRKDSENIGFAIPSNDAKKVADALIDKGYVSWPYIGIDIRNENLNNEPIIYINNIMNDSPAEKAGFRDGDIVLKINDARVKTVAEFRRQINACRIGDTISVYVARKEGNDFHQGVISVKLGELPKGYHTLDWS